MSLNIENQILNKIKKAKRGSLFFTENFIKIGSSDAIRKALERLVKNQELERVTAGMYVRPEIDPYIGKVPPNIEAIAEAIAKRDGARIVPTGVYALNRLGLRFIRNLEQEKPTLRLDKVNQVLDLFGSEVGVIRKVE